MSSEFDLIRKFFTKPAPRAVLGVGDDAALLAVAAGMELAVSSDMLVSGRHFFADADPRLLGRKALAVNLSDMAAMGATPRWATLALALPNADEAWLAAFAEGFFSMAEAFEVDLVGGDTTAGPLNISVTILGEVPAGRALRRAAAQAGDDIWVSGRLGNAALALAHLEGRIHLAPREADGLLPALLNPKPRVALGQALLGIAHAAIDISDGLLADLGHILSASKLGAEIEFVNLPASDTLTRQLGDDIAIECLLAGGDDYELCFTAPPEQRAEIRDLGQELGLPLTRIGMVGFSHGIRVRDESGKEIHLGRSGFDHFA